MVVIDNATKISDTDFILAISSANKIDMKTAKFPDGQINRYIYFRTYHHQEYALTQNDPPTCWLIGCAHEFTRKELGTCYNEYSCKFCTFSYRVDSSD